jgi:hypothetical protein
MLPSTVDQAQDISEHHFGEIRIDTNQMEASYKNGYAPSSRKKLYRDKEDRIKSLRELYIYIRPEEISGIFKEYCPCHWKF